MKKIAAAVLCVALLFCFTGCKKSKQEPVTEPPATTEKLDFEYTLVTDAESVKSVVITAYTGKGGEVDIPNKIEDFPVKEIAEAVFQNNKDITKVDLPSHLVKIGKSAFEGCSELRFVSTNGSIGVLPAKLAEIGSFAFSHTALSGSIAIPDTLTEIPAGLFEHCEELTILKIGSGVKKIGSQAFQNCPKLYCITFSADCKDIAENAAQSPAQFYIDKDLPGVKAAALKMSVGIVESHTAESTAAESTTK